MSLPGIEISDLPSGSKSISSDSASFSNLGIDSLKTPDTGAGATAASLPDVSISEGAPVEIQTLEPYFLNIGELNITTAAQNEASGAVPDFILSADGKLRQNPNKSVIAQDGNLNIQVEGNDSQAIKAANEAQKATVRDLIRHYQKYNPGKPVPQEWTDKLHSEPNLPAQSNRAESRPSVAPDYDPSSSSGNSAPERSYSPTPFANPGGGTRSSGMSPGYRGASSGNNRSYEAAPIGPRGNIESFAPVQGDLAMKGPPTITADKIDEVLKSYGSPATGLGQLIYDEGVKTGINPAVALAFFIQESSAGTAGVARHTNSFGNIKGEGPAGSYKGFRAYNNWEEGVKDWYRLIDDKYLASPSEGGRGYTHLSQVLHTYAPTSENNTNAYIANVKGMVQGWDTGSSNANVA